MTPKMIFEKMRKIQKEKKPKSADPPRRVGLNRAASLGVDPSHCTLNRFVPKWAPGLGSGPEDLSILQGLAGDLKAARGGGCTP